MATPNLTLNGKPSIPDGETRLRVQYYDSANPLTDETGTARTPQEYPEFTEYIEIPIGQTYDSTLIDSLVLIAYTQALSRAETWAAACEIKAVLLPVLEVWEEQ